MGVGGGVGGGWVGGSVGGGGGPQRRWCVFNGCN